MTFWAQNGRSDEYRLFRAVCFKRDDEALLCQDDDKITIPAEQDDNHMISPNMSDYLNYLALDAWRVDAVFNPYLALPCFGNIR